MASSDPIFTVVTDGIERALAKAQEVAADKRIGLMGANIDQQFLAAGWWTRSGSTWSMSCSDLEYRVLRSAPIG